MRRRPPRATQSRSAAASDVYKRQIIIVPVKVDGAGIYAGDVHAMIGDGEVAVHTTDIGARLVVRVEIIKGLALDGPILLPPADDLPFLARPFTACLLYTSDAADD